MSYTFKPYWGGGEPNPYLNPSGARRSFNNSPDFVWLLRVSGSRSRVFEVWGVESAVERSGSSMLGPVLMPASPKRLHVAIWYILRAQSG